MRHRVSYCGVVAAYVLCMSLSFCASSSTKKEPIDIQIAKYSAIIGTNRLSKDISDEKGLLLIRLCGALDRKNETFLFTCNLLRKQMKPDFIATKVSEDKLLSVMQSRLLKIHKTSYPKNKKVAKLILLYGKVIEKFKPREKDVMVTLEALVQDGFDDSLDTLLAKDIDLKELFRVTTVDAPKIADVVAATPKAGEIVISEDIDIKIDLPADKDEFEKSFVVDEKVEIRPATLFRGKKARKKEFKYETVVFPRHGGGIRTKFALVGDFTFQFHGEFEQLNMELCGRKVRLPDSKVEGVRWFEVSREGNTVTINGARRAKTKIYDFEVVGSARKDPTTISIDSKNAKYDGWIRTLRVIGKGIWPKK